MRIEDKVWNVIYTLQLGQGLFKDFPVGGGGIF